MQASPAQRGRRAGRRFRPARFVVYSNPVVGTSANGTETFYSAKNTSKNEWGVTSKDLATRMQKAVQSVIGRYNRGVKVNSNLAVLTHTNMPAVLVEAAFVSNKTDAAILKNSDKIDELAQAIHDVIVESFE